MIELRGETGGRPLQRDRSKDWKSWGYNSTGLFWVIGSLTASLGVTHSNIFWYQVLTKCWGLAERHILFTTSSYVIRPKPPACVGISCVLLLADCCSLSPSLHPQHQWSRLPLITQSILAQCCSERQIYLEALGTWKGIVAGDRKGICWVITASKVIRQGLPGHLSLGYSAPALWLGPALSQQSSSTVAYLLPQ